MYGFEGVGLSGVQLSISELSVVDLVGGLVMTGQTHFMVGPGRGPTNIYVSIDWTSVLNIIYTTIELSVDHRRHDVPQ